MGRHEDALRVREAGEDLLASSKALHGGLQVDLSDVNKLLGQCHWAAWT